VFYSVGTSPEERKESSTSHQVQGLVDEGRKCHVTKNSSVVLQSQSEQMIKEVLQYCL